ncbi:MAG: shikimate kinase [Deltaproteobacteria bacterium]|nr:MAG: shikimate kinase [Deltaproteobacteria bacterium]
MNIVLIGYRGTGKSVVGRILADQLAMTYIGMDEEIVKKAGASVPEIVEKQGWKGFRDMESEVAREAADKDNVIIDTGGGVIERQENIDVLRKNGLVFWLKASVDVIVSRISGDDQRPALTGGKSFTDEVSEVLERRIPRYREAAHYEIDTDAISPAQVAQAVIDIWTREKDE